MGLDRPRFDLDKLGPFRQTTRANGGDAPADPKKNDGWQGPNRVEFVAMPTDALTTINITEKNPALLYLLSLTTKGSRDTQRYALEDFVRFALAGSNLRSFPWQDVRPEHVLLYRDFLLERVKVRTVNKNVGAIRSVAKMAWIVGLIDAETLARIQEVRKVKGKGPRSGRDLKTKELAALVVEAEKTRWRWHRVRDVALLTLLYASGMRRAEVARLSLSDVEIGPEHIRIKAFGKGHKERFIFISLEFVAPLKAWLDLRGLADGAFFTRHHSTRGIVPKTIHRVVTELGKRAALGRVTPHDFRRTFAGRLIGAGADLPSVSALMGHENVSTTALYDLRGEQAAIAAANKLPKF